MITIKNSKYLLFTVFIVYELFNNETEPIKAGNKSFFELDVKKEELPVKNKKNKDTDQQILVDDVFKKIDKSAVKVIIPKEKNKKTDFLKEFELNVPAIDKYLSKLIDDNDITITSKGNIIVESRLKTKERLSKLYGDNSALILNNKVCLVTQIKQCKLYSLEKVAGVFCIRPTLPGYKKGSFTLKVFCKNFQYELY